MTQTISEDNGRFESPGIVSVNERAGQGSSDFFKKVLFVAIAFGVVAVGGVFGVNQWHAAQKGRDAQVTQAAKVENKPAQVGPKRNFEADRAQTAQRQARVPNPPVPTGAPVVASAPAAASAEPPCHPVTVQDTAGKAILGINGQPITVGCDGKLIPAIDPNAAPGMAGATGQPTAKAGERPRRKSRYGGDVFIESKAGPAAGQGATPEVLLAQGASAGVPPVSQAAPSPFVGTSTTGNGGGGLISTAAAAEPTVAVAGTPNTQGAVGALLTPTTVPKVTAAHIGDRDMLLAKGAQIDCALTTRVINEVSGFASCILTSNVYSDNGKVVLLERGSDAQGEYVAAMEQGQRRLFVLWTRVKTPTGVVINLNSPAADGLGTMGLEGYVDNRWWDRIGAAFLLSLVQDAIAYQIAKASNGANTTAGGVVFQNTARTGDQMAERILSATINIKPTIYKNQGDRASIYVARDLDFSAVYALRPE